MSWNRSVETVSPWISEIIEIFEKTRSHPQRIHSITNYVTINDCANILLAMGASPIMADDPDEVEEVTAQCQGLVINLGTLKSWAVDGMVAAGKKANALGHPVVLDPVGVGVSALRRNAVKRLMEAVDFSVIRGNISEIKTLAVGVGHAAGVDAKAADQVTEENLSETLRWAQRLSKKTGSVMAITGAVDMIVDVNRAFTIENGDPLMSRVTGSGCMLSAIMGAYVAANPDRPLMAAVCAASVMGIAGEKAVCRMSDQGLGTGSLRTLIIDQISLMSAQDLASQARIQCRIS